MLSDTRPRESSTTLSEIKLRHQDQTLLLLETLPFSFYERASDIRSLILSNCPISEMECASLPRLKFTPLSLKVRIQLGGGRWYLALISTILLFSTILEARNSTSRLSITKLSSGAR